MIAYYLYKNEIKQNSEFYEKCILSVHKDRKYNYIPEIGLWLSCAVLLFGESIPHYERCDYLYSVVSMISGFSCAFGAYKIRKEYDRMANEHLEEINKIRNN